MRRHRFVGLGAVLSGFLLMLLAGPASSSVIVLDPDNYTDGEVLSTVVPGLTLTGVAGGGATGDITALTAPSIASTGTNVFNSPFAISGQFGDGTWDYMLIDVTGLGGVQSVSLDFVATDSEDLNPILAAYDLAGNLITSVTDPGTFSTGQFTTLTVAGAGIAQVAALGDPTFIDISTIANLNAATSGGPDSWGFDNLRVTTVPEPTTLALMVIGLAGIGLTKRLKGLPT